MKLSRLLAAITIVSAFSFGSADANAKSKSRRSKSTHSSETSSKSKSKSKSPQAAMPTDDAASAESDKAAAPAADKSEGAAGAEAPAAGAEAPATTTTTTTTTTTDDTKTATPPESGAAGATAPDTAIPAPSEVVPMSQPAPEAVAPPPAPAAPSRSIVFLPMVSANDRAGYGYAPTLGIAVSAGGGAIDFVGGAIKAATNIGGFWTVRALVGSRSIVGLEAAYVGSAQNVASLGLSNGASLLGNGVEGTMRLNAPVAVKGFLIEPFGFAGAGWTHYSIVNTPTVAADINNSDDVIVLPVGGGISMGYRGLFLDGRFTYRFSYDNDLIRTPNVQTGLDNWNAGATIGYEF
jgi:hypothetical protein